MLSVLSKAVFHRFNRTHLQRYLQVNPLMFSDVVRKSSPASTSQFSADEEMHIVKVINKCEVNEFEKYDIKEGQLKKLLAYRERNGKFQTFNDVLMTQDVTSFIKFCKSVLSGGKRIQIPRSTGTSKNLVVPSIDEVTRSTITNVIGLSVHGSIITWCSFNADGKVNEWNFAQFENPSKTTIAPLINLIMNIALKMPLADVYVMESDVYTTLGKLKPTFYQIHLQRQQVIAILISVLKTRQCIKKDNLENTKDNFYMMQARQPAKLFKLNVGNETVGAQAVIDKIISGDGVMNLPGLPPVCIDSGVIDNYSAQSAEIREQLHLTLLLTLAFSNYIHIISNRHKL